jgi:hypothetical protein
VPVLLTPFCDRFQTPAEPFTDRLHVHGAGGRSVADR